MKTEAVISLDNHSCTYWGFNKIDTILQIKHFEKHFLLQETFIFWLKFHHSVQAVTHCGLVTWYGDIDLGQHWFTQWLVAWHLQVLTGTNVDFSLARFHGIHLRGISQWVSKVLCKLRLNTIYAFKITAKSPRGQWVNELISLHGTHWHSPDLKQNWKSLHHHNQQGDSGRHSSVTKYN